VVDLELTNPSSTSAPNANGQILALARLHGVPLGILPRLDPRQLTGPDPNSVLVAAALREFHEAIVEHLRLDGVPAPTGSPNELADLAATPCSSLPSAPDRPATVVLCSLGEEPRLVETVHSLLSQSHRSLELIVVDNAPESGQVSRALSSIEDPRLRIVAESRRGLSVARNTGLASATSTWIAYTDDDAVADLSWLSSLLAPFDEHPDVVCVTGLVLPAELATQAQLWFEEFGAFDKGFRRLVWSRRHGDERLSGLGESGEAGPLFPYSAGVFGSGNNMAFRTDWLREHGGFDVALGAGTRSRGGEDLDAFLGVMLGDRVIVYEPAALIRHYARADLPALRRQMYGYGSGMSAVIVKHLTRSPRSAFAVVTRIPAGVRKLLDPGSEKNAARSTTFPTALIVAELRGYLAGPLLYVFSLRHARRCGLYPSGGRA
jgi:glycosyltransferase involved in cell wall biosynthesis